MLQIKDVYPYEYMDFYSNLNMEDIKDSGYNHARGVCKESVKTLGEYHDLYLKSDILILTDILNTLEKCV